jgi:hypothetical protein
MSIILKDDNPLTDTAEIWTDVAEKASWDLANGRQKLGLVWENRMQISQINNDCLFLLFSLLFILWPQHTFTPFAYQNTQYLKNQ